MHWTSSQTLFISWRDEHTIVSDEPLKDSVKMSAPTISFHLIGYWQLKWNDFERQWSMTSIYFANLLLERNLFSHYVTDFSIEKGKILANKYYTTVATIKLSFFRHENWFNRNIESGSKKGITPSLEKMLFCHTVNNVLVQYLIPHMRNAKLCQDFWFMICALLIYRLVGHNSLFRFIVVTTNSIFSSWKTAFHRSEKWNSITYNL